MLQNQTPPFTGFEWTSTIASPQKCLSRPVYPDRMLYDKEEQKGNANRATLAVARKPTVGSGIFK
jgi:hypothetical protein